MSYETSFAAWSCGPILELLDVIKTAPMGFMTPTLTHAGALGHAGFEPEPLYSFTVAPWFSA